MNIQVLQTLINCLSEKDFSNKNQKECFKLAKLIIIINQKVNKNGINILEYYIQEVKIKYPLLERGLSLIRQGIEPEYIESILLNIVIINKIDFLMSLIVLEGIFLIQNNQSPYITKEILKSFFSLNFQSYFESEFKKENIEIDEIQVLSNREVNDLLNKYNKVKNVE